MKDNYELAISIRFGSWNDPIDKLGLGTLIQHMLLDV